MKKVSNKDTGRTMFPNSDLIIKPVEELRKVLGTITLFGELGSIEFVRSCGSIGIHRVDRRSAYSDPGGSSGSYGYTR